MSEVHFPAGTTSVGGSYLNETAGIDFGRKTPGLQKDIMPEEASGRDGVSNRGFTPDACRTDADMSALRGLMVATLSPGAMLAALCVEEAAKQNEQSTAELLKRNDAIQADINSQADKIEKAAMQQMALAITGAVVSAGMSIAGAVVTCRGGGGDALTIAKAKGDAIASSGNSISGIFNAVGGYLESKAQAENKRLDADIEQHRTVIETLKNSMQAQRDLIAKSLEFMNSMQSSMNQTMSRIMG